MAHVISPFVPPSIPLSVLLLSPSLPANLVPVIMSGVRLGLGNSTASKPVASSPWVDSLVGDGLGSYQLTGKCPIQLWGGCPGALRACRGVGMSGDLREGCRGGQLELEPKGGLELTSPAGKGKMC